MRRLVSEKTQLPGGNWASKSAGTGRRGGITPYRLKRDGLLRSIVKILDFVLLGRAIVARHFSVKPVRRVRDVPETDGVGG